MALVTTEESLSRVLALLDNSKGPVVYDVETNGLHPYLGMRIIGHAFYIPSVDESFYIPVRHNPMSHDCVEWRPLPEVEQPTKRKRVFDPGYERFPDGLVYKMAAMECAEIDLNFDPIRVSELLQLFFISGRPTFGWNVKFDKHCYTVEGLDWENPSLDPMLGCHLLNENEMSYELDSLSQKYCGGDARKADDRLLAWGKAKWGKATSMSKVKGHLADAPLWDVAYYAEQDCRLTWAVSQKIVPKLKEEKLYKLWKEQCEYANDAIFSFEQAGIQVDQKRAEESMQHAKVRTDSLYESMARMAGKDFNPGSNEQLAEILYGWKKVPGSKARHPSTAKAALERCSHPLVPVLQEWRQWNKAVTTYYRPWLILCDECGRIHPNIVTHGTVSGRGSCRNPNMQNLPRMDERTVYDVRRAIICKPGNILLSRDYSQIELRVTTEYCRDPLWWEVYNSADGDIHQSTSDLLCGLGLNVTRQDAKTINFAMLYNMGPDALAGTLKISRPMAEKILHHFRNSKPSLVKLSRETQRFAREWGYIELWTGRKRHYPFSWMTHTALNNLIQGGAAEIKRHAIIKLNRLLKKTPVRMILEIHDDILFEMPASCLAEFNPMIREVMETFPNFDVPIKTEGKAGYSWDFMAKCDGKETRIDDELETLRLKMEEKRAKAA